MTTNSEPPMPSSPSPSTTARRRSWHSPTIFSPQTSRSRHDNSSPDDPTHTLNPLALFLIIALLGPDDPSPDDPTHALNPLALLLTMPSRWPSPLPSPPSPASPASTFHRTTSPGASPSPSTTSSASPDSSSRTMPSPEASRASNVSGLEGFNVSGNALNGSIPLARFPESSFSGNLDLCGGPLRGCNTPFFPPTPAPSVLKLPLTRKSSGGLSRAALIAICVGAAVILLLLFIILFMCLGRRRRERASKTPKPVVPRSIAAGSAEAGTSSSKDEIGMGPGESERNKLLFLDGGVYSFDLEDLLRASAEVLGKVSVGTSYKAVLEEGTTVVVKRLKDVSVTKKEIELQMEALGKVKHENVLPLRAFYFSKDYDSTTPLTMTTEERKACAAFTLLTPPLFPLPLCQPNQTKPTTPHSFCTLHSCSPPP